MREREKSWEKGWKRKGYCHRVVARCTTGGRVGCGGGRRGGLLVACQYLCLNCFIASSVQDSTPALLRGRNSFLGLCKRGQCKLRHDSNNDQLKKLTIRRSKSLKITTDAKRNHIMHFGLQRLNKPLISLSLQYRLNAFWRNIRAIDLA